MVWQCFQDTVVFGRETTNLSLALIARFTTKQNVSSDLGKEPFLSGWRKLILINACLVAH